MDLTACLSEIAIFLPSSIDVLDRFSLDYYCNGRKSFVQACKERNLDAVFVWKEIVKAPPAVNNVSSLTTWEPAILRQLILQHFNDLNDNASLIKECLDELQLDCTAAEYALIEEIRSCHNSILELLEHHAHSEKIVFSPLRERLFDEKMLESQWPDRLSAGSRSIEELENDHGQIGLLIEQLRFHTNNYAMSRLSSASAQVTGILLRQFDKQLTQRIHLENNILFPKLR
jgi:regulator of cell morphogenesis and NO signaling